MHNLQTRDGSETTVAPPETGALLVGNSVNNWQPLPVNASDELMVLTQRHREMPVWQVLNALPMLTVDVRQQAIDNPSMSASGFGALQEVQELLTAILNVLRHYDMIDPTPGK